MKVETALIDPRWEWGVMNLNGFNHIVLTLHHPVHGPITSVIPDDVVASMGMGLADLVAKQKSHQA